VKNVAQTYSLEHVGEKDLFKHLFELLQQDLKNDRSLKRELASCIGAIQTSLNQHMSKEEEQVTFALFFLLCHLVGLGSATFIAIF
jgi:zinc finger protein-like protein